MHSRLLPPVQVSLWVLLDQSRWWTNELRNAIEDQGRRARGAPGGGGGGMEGGHVGPGGGAAGAVLRVVAAARRVGMGHVPPRAVTAMMAALALPEQQWRGLGEGWAWTGAGLARQMEVSRTPVLDGL